MHFTLMALDPVVVYGNCIEACVWAVLSVFALARRRKPWRTALGFTLLIFGASDVVEAHTGAWYHPWWLFVWKAACVGGLAFFGLKALTARRKPAVGYAGHDEDQAISR